MKYLKVQTDNTADFQKLKIAIEMLSGVENVEIIDEENPESELKKAFAKTKEQLKKGDYETVVNDIFDIFAKTGRKTQTAEENTAKDPHDCTNKNSAATE